jgi:hypothetical protein
MSMMKVQRMLAIDGVVDEESPGVSLAVNDKSMR